jgi:hypothetical protein
MLSTDWFWLNQESTDWPGITEEPKDFPTSGNSKLFLKLSNSKTASALVSAWGNVLYRSYLNPYFFKCKFHFLKDNFYVLRWIFIFKLSKLY